MFFPNVEIAGDGELRDSLYLLFSEQLYGTKKKKKKKGEGDRGEQEGESRRRRAGEGEREGARGVCLGGRVCAPERGWEAGLATGSASESFSSRPPHPHSPPSRPQTESRGLAANFGRWGKEGRRRENPWCPNLPLSPVQGQKLEWGEDSVPTSETLSGTELVRVRIRIRLRTHRFGYPHLGTEGSFLQPSPTQPRTEKKLQRN